MSITQSNSELEPPLDYLIEYTKGAITEQAATIERLADQGHEVTEQRST